MKLIIASDIHGSAYHCRKLIEIIQSEQPDKILLLGDLLYHGPRNALPKDYDPKQVVEMLNPYADSILAVRGNCDSEVDQMVLAFPMMADYAMACTDGQDFYLSHGHIASPDNLPKLKERTVFLSGHIHTKVDKLVNGIRCMNPGSVSIPKDGSHSCLVYDNGQFRFVTWEETL